MKKRPQTAFERSRTLVHLASDLAKKEVGFQARKFFSFAKDTIEKTDRLKTQFEQAKKLVETLGNMKGAAMKVGQLLSIEGADFLPPEVIQILSQLQDSGSTLEYKMVCELIDQELGAAKRQALLELTETPVASASIGQVHRARIGDQGVAIKIQFPGIADAIDSDVKILRNVLKGLLLVSNKEVDFNPLLNELTAVLKQETDYRIEAELQLEYAKHIANSEPFLKNHLIVPTIFPEFCSQKILTTSFETGLRVKDWLKDQPTRENKEHFAHLLIELYFAEFYRWGLIQTDPNTANFLIRPDTQQLVLLDFGATKRYDSEFRKHYLDFILALSRNDEDSALSIAHQFGLLDPRESPETIRLFFDFVSQTFEPFRPSAQPFDFNDEAFTRLTREKGLQFARALKYTPPPKNLIFAHRKLGGLFHMIKSFEVSIDLVPYWERLNES